MRLRSFSLMPLGALALVSVAASGACGGGVAGAGGSSSSTTTSGATSAQGTTASTTGGAMCGTVQECAATVNDCQHPTCVDHHCGVENASPGPVPVDENPGDCLRRTCDAQGKATDAPDDTDVPKSPSQCVIASCHLGMVIHTNAPPGTVCASGACDGNGTCVPTG